MADKTVHLMRGLPSTGKSHTSRQIAGAGGTVCETDAYFYSEVGDDPTRYDYRHDLLPAARQWNFERFCHAVDDGVPVVVVDRGNSLSADSQAYARYAVDKGYRVVLSEPRSKWWQELRVLLKYKRHTKPVLVAWAQRLSQLNRSTHRVSPEQILRLMARWRYDLKIEDILNFHEPAQDQSDPTAVTDGGMAAGRTGPSTAAERVMDHILGPAHKDGNGEGHDLRSALVKGVRLLQSDFGASTSPPIYFDAGRGGVDGGIDGGDTPPTVPDLVFDEITGEFSSGSDDPLPFLIEGATREPDAPADGDDGGWIVEGVDLATTDEGTTATGDTGTGEDGSAPDGTPLTVDEAPPPGSGSKRSKDGKGK